MKKDCFAWILIAVAFVCVLCMNVFCIPGHDELSFSFRRIPGVGLCSTGLSSLYDIVCQQYSDYHHYNPRVFVHGIVSIFSTFRLHYLFDVINTCIWFVFVYQIFHEVHSRMPSVNEYLQTFAFVFLFWWYAESTCMNAAFGVNYLWMASATLLVMKLWRDDHSWRLIPFVFFYGWGHEGFALPMVVSLTGSVIVKSLFARRYAATIRQTVILLFMIAGAGCIISSPALQNRASGVVGFSTLTAIKTFCHGMAGLALAIWPIVILCLVAAVFLVAIRKRGLYDDLEWWFYLVVALSIFAVVCKAGLYRVAAPALLAAIVLTLKHGQTVRKWFPVCIARNGFRIPVMCIFCFLVCGSALQVSYGLENFKMLRRYKASSSGVTYRRILPPLFFSNMCNFGLYACHLQQFQWRLGQTKRMVIFPESLYRCLILNTDCFFKKAKELPHAGLYVHTDFPCVVFKKGKMSDSDIEYIRKESGKLSTKPLPNWVPGRVYDMLAYPMVFLETGNAYTTIELDWNSCISIYKIED